MGALPLPITAAAAVGIFRKSRPHPSPSCQPSFSVALGPAWGSLPTGAPSMPALRGTAAEVGIKSKESILLPILSPARYLSVGHRKASPSHLTEAPFTVP